MKPARAAGGQTFPKLSAFAKLLRENIGNWDEVASGTETPPKKTADRFLKEFTGHIPSGEGKIGTPGQETFINWWQGKNRPHEKQMNVVYAVLFGADADKTNRKIALQKAWQAADKKAVARKAKDAPPAPIATDPLRPRYETRLRRSKPPHAAVVGMEIDLAGLGQGMLEGGLPVVLTLNWGFDDDFDLPCKLYLKEFHLIAELENCSDVPRSHYKGETLPGLEVSRAGLRWMFKAGEGRHLEGEFNDIDCLFTIKPSDDADGPVTVKVMARCPGVSAEHIDIEWAPEPSDLDTQQKAVIGRFIAKCHESAREGPLKLGWVGVSLVEKKP